MADQQTANVPGATPPFVGSSTPDSTDGMSSKDDPVIISGLRKSDINKMMILQSIYSKIMSSPALKATVNPTLLMSLGQIVDTQAKSVLGKLVGENNLETLYSAMNGKQPILPTPTGQPMPAGAGGPHAAPGSRVVPTVAGAHLNAPNQAAYAQQLAGLQQKANNAFKQQGPPDMMGPRWQKQMNPGGDMSGLNNGQPPAWFSALPVEQQLSLLGRNPATGGIIPNQQMSWVPPTDDHGVNLAPGIRYNAESKQFEKSEGQ